MADQPVSPPSSPSSLQVRTEGGSPAQPEEDEETLFSFLGKVSRTLFKTKHMVMQLGSDVPAELQTADPETQKKVHLLHAIAQQTEKLEIHARTLLNNFKNYSESVQNFGNLLYEIGIKEEGSQQAIVTIGANLRSAGNYHRAIANKKNTVDVENALNSLINSVSVFRRAVLEDTMTTYKNYEELSLDYQHTVARLAELEAQGQSQEKKIGMPTPEEIAKLRVQLEESRKKAQKAGEDLSTKVVLLDDKRIQIITKDLQSYLKALRKYFGNAVTMPSSSTPSPSPSSSISSLPSPPPSPSPSYSTDQGSQEKQ